MADYFTYGMIVYCRPQMIWIIEWLDSIGDGDWPVDPVESGYSGNSGGSAPAEGYFAAAARVYSDVMTRLDRTGEAGETLVWEIQHGIDSYERLSPAAKDALNYISGWRTRSDSFKSWRYNKKRQKSLNKNY
jgi:hypothetical protein